MLISKAVIKPDISDPSQTRVKRYIAILHFFGKLLEFSGAQLELIKINSADLLAHWFSQTWNALTGILCRFVLHSIEHTYKIQKNMQYGKYEKTVTSRPH